MNLKVGDKLLCKKDGKKMLVQDGELHLIKKGNYYTISHYRLTKLPRQTKIKMKDDIMVISFDVEGCSLLLHLGEVENTLISCYKEFFYTPSELRRLKLEQINGQNNIKLV